MNKITKLLTISFIASNLLGTMPMSLAQDDNSTRDTTEENQKSTSILDALLSVLKSPENRLITRGDRVCLISPGQLGENIVYSDRPILVWSLLQSETPESTLNVYSDMANFNYEQDSQLIWSETIAANVAQIPYQQDALEPGFLYKWQLVFPEKTYTSNFEVVEGSERELITQELSILERELQATNSSAEDIAIAKADYFAEKQLWSDVVQELYIVENPSSSLLEKRREMELYLCGISKAKMKYHQN